MFEVSRWVFPLNFGFISPHLVSFVLQTLPPTRSKPPHPPDFNRSQSSKSPRVGQSSPGSSPQTPRAQSFPSSPPAFGPFQGSSLKSLSQKGSPLSLSRDPSPTRSSPVSKGSKTPSETSDGNPQSPYGSPSQPPISNPLRWARRNSPPGVSIKSNEEGVGLQLKRIDGGWPVEQQSNPPARHDREGGYAQGPVPQNPPKWLRNRQSSDTSQPKTSPRNVPGSVVDKPSHDSQPKAEKLSPPEYNSTNTSSPGYNSANTSTSQPTGEQARNIEASTVREQVALETASSLRTAPGVTKSQPVDTNARAEKVSYNEDHQASKDASSGGEDQAPLCRFFSSTPCTFCVG